MGNLLEFLGVKAQEDQLYRALLRRESVRPAVAQETVLDTEYEESTLDSLVTLGLATRGSSGGVRPVPPPRAVDALIEGRLRLLREELEGEVARHAVIESLFLERRPTVPSIRAESGEEGETGDHDRPIRQLQGIEAVREAIDELTFFARIEDLTTEPNGILTQESIAVSHPINMRLLRRGVRMRTIMGAAVLQDETSLSYMRELVLHGAEVRVSRHPIERVIIIDRVAALTPIDPEHTSRGALLVREPGLVATLCTLYERMWEAAEELPGDDMDLPSDIERKILAILRKADKDETAARQLSMSVRTYRKHLAAIMRRLNAANRVEAALIAYEKGWLT